jgi:mycofactocin system creatininase family protein
VTGPLQGPDASLRAAGGRGSFRSLAGAVWPEVPEAPLLVVPLGSVEQHGHHLPLGTDTSVACAVAEAAAGSLDGALLAPSLAYGASGEHESFPGTISIGTEALTGLLVEYGRSAGRWAGRVLLVNGHGGNLDALCSAVPLLRKEGRDVAWFPCGVPNGDAHAGRTETSLMLHVEPDLVRKDRAVPGVTEPLGVLLPRLRAEGVRGVSPTGVLGDPAGASRAEGAALLADMARRLVGAARAWDVDDAGRLRS